MRHVILATSRVLAAQDNQSIHCSTNLKEIHEKNTQNNEFVRESTKVSDISKAPLSSCSPFDVMQLCYYIRK